MALKPKSFLYTVDPATAVATITLNRPERLNALTFEVYTELRDTFRALDTEPGVRAVIITGTGRAFCTGGDVEDIIGALFSRDAAGLLEFTRLTGDLILSIRQCPPPGRGGAQRHGGRRGGRDRGGQRHPDRGGERQDRLPLLAGGPGRRRHGGGLAPAPDRRPGARERAPHAGGLHHRRARRPDRALQPGGAGGAIDGGSDRCRRPAGAGPVGRAGRHQAGAQRGGRDGPGHRASSGRPRPRPPACRTPTSARPTRPSAPSATRSSSSHAGHETDPHLSRAAAHARSPSGPAPSRRERSPGAPSRSDDAAAPERGAGPARAARRGRLAPADSRPRSPRVLPDARGARRSVAARRRGVRAAGAGHDADPAERIAGAEGPLARADRPGEGDDRLRDDRARSGLGRGRDRHHRAARWIGLRPRWQQDPDLQRRDRRPLHRLRLHRPGQGCQGDQLLSGAGGCAGLRFAGPAGAERPASAGGDRVRGLPGSGGRAAGQPRGAATGSASRRSTGCGPRWPPRPAAWPPGRSPSRWRT